MCSKPHSKRWRRSGGLCLCDTWDVWVKNIWKQTCMESEKSVDKAACTHFLSYIVSIPHLMKHFTNLGQVDRMVWLNNSEDLGIKGSNIPLHALNLEKSAVKGKKRLWPHPEARTANTLLWAPLMMPQLSVPSRDQSYKFLCRTQTHPKIMKQIKRV